MPALLDSLDRRIAGALQADGRAPWRRIAEVLDAPERTVARRGTQLLRTGVVTVIAVSPHGVPLLLRGTCQAGLGRPAATALAVRPETSFCYLSTGPRELVAEVFCDRARLPTFMFDEMAGIPGVQDLTADTVTRYYRTVHEWQPDLLTSAETAALAPFPQPTPQPRRTEGAVFSSEERAIVRALREDGRRTHDELARAAGTSESTVRRRLDALRREERVFIRAVVEPAVLGLPVEALLWIRCRPHRVDGLGRALLSSPFVRYAAAMTGEYQLVADVTLPDIAALHDFVGSSQWSRLADSVHTGVLLKALKRSGVLAPELRS
ncbi:Lrp/AsnC family transcriptional regulator [Amycolatopsis benzoatilytica]|uniref:Lrp/AsnC family transcriptional regulator n=1 Tax=Amycolatopsis benzoatilytica TaxID=346045 RepID=UPI00036CD682|nr:Lrp/AsnC family transcriptional regulator [Amycolatopsis benzoatilytica]